MASEHIEVFDYLDFREYLRAYYDAKKASGRGFSYRVFSRLAGLKSPNYLKLVIDGDRNLTPAMAQRFGSACGLEDDGLRFFGDLVAFNQAKTSAERARRYRELTGHRGFRRAQRLDVAQSAYFGEWFIPAIRELALSDDFRADPEWIAKQMIPAISKADATRGLRVLEELKMLEVHPDLTATPTDTLVSSGEETKWVHMGEYHRVMMKRAAESIDIVPSAERDISSVTLCLDEGALLLVKRRIQELRQELLAMSEEAANPSQVVQLNFQLFPLTRGIKETS